MQKDWQTLLHASIPLAQAMQVRVQAQPDGRLALVVPLAPNRNDKGTGFGGSLATLATLAGWVETQRQLDQAGLGEGVEIVIQRGETEYLLPAEADFCACVLPLTDEDSERFCRLFARRGLARLTLQVTLYCGELLVARFRGDYVAKRADGT
jgi:thioesterase domain-containing protein